MFCFRVSRARELRTLACALAFATLGASPHASATDDAPLLRSLRSDARLGPCACLVAARWLNDSYPRVVVDEIRWRRLAPAARTLFARRALDVARSVYLSEFASVDQYERIFIVDRRGRTLLEFGDG
ncbi:MAG: hypothetical protein NVS2B3_17810 [Vulcanimicrobiaceae bacterium]